MEIWRDILDEDIDEVVRFLRAGQLTAPSGGVMEEFESAFAREMRAHHAVSFNNGTASIYAALWAVGVRAGDDVLVCDYSFHAVAAAVIALGARVVPVDCTPDSLTCDPADLRLAVTPKTKAVVIHNPWGVPAEFDDIRWAAGNLPLIGDASHAHGALYRGRPLAAWLDVSCYSLGMEKLISGGELGCAVTNDVALRDRLLICGHVNRVPRGLSGSTWTGNAVGLKLRPHAVACILAAGQLRRFSQKRQLNREVGHAMEEAAVAAGFAVQRVPHLSERVYWRVVLHIGDSFASVSTSTIEATLRRWRIPVQRNHYWPLLSGQDLFQWPGHEHHLLKRVCPTANQRVPRTITFAIPTVVPGEWLRDLRRALLVSSIALRASQRPLIAPDASPRSEASGVGPSS